MKFKIPMHGVGQPSDDEFKMAQHYVDHFIEDAGLPPERGAARRVEQLLLKWMAEAVCCGIRYANDRDRVVG